MTYIEGLKRLSKNKDLLQSDPSFQKLLGYAENRDNQLTELAKAAENMLELLVNNAPIDGLWSSDMDDWDCLIKEAK